MKEKPIIKVMIGCAIICVSIVGIIIWVVTWISGKFLNFEWEWLNNIIQATMAILTGIGGWFMLPVLMVLIAGIFLEKIIHTVELKDYPDKVRKKPPKLWPDIIHDIKFTGWALLLNIIILPFHFLAIGIAVSIALNTYLLGREFFEITAGYHHGKPAAKTFGKENKFVMYFGGFIITLITLIPLINFFSPIFAVIWMVHVYHQIPKKPETV